MYQRWNEYYCQSVSKAPEIQKPRTLHPWQSKPPPYSQPRLSHPINGFSSILHCKPLWDISKWFEIALDQGLNKVACLILCVPFRHIHNKRLNHQSPWSSINDFRMKGNDWRVVLKEPRKEKETVWTPSGLFHTNQIINYQARNQIGSNYPTKTVQGNFKETGLVVMGKLYTETSIWLQLIYQQTNAITIRFRTWAEAHSGPLEHLHFSGSHNMH